MLLSDNMLSADYMVLPDIMLSDYMTLITCYYLIACNQLITWHYLITWYYQITCYQVTCNQLITWCYQLTFNQILWCYCQDMDFLARRNYIFLNIYALLFLGSWLTPVGIYCVWYITRFFLMRIFILEVTVQKYQSMTILSILVP
jgi:hypothetical protein